MTVESKNHDMYKFIVNKTYKLSIPFNEFPPYWGLIVIRRTAASIWVGTPGYSDKSIHGINAAIRRKIHRDNNCEMIYFDRTCALVSTIWASDILITGGQR